MQVKKVKGPAGNGCLKCGDWQKDHVFITVGSFRICLCVDCAKKLVEKIEEAIKDGN